MRGRSRCGDGSSGPRCWSWHPHGLSDTDYDSLFTRDKPPEESEEGAVRVLRPRILKIFLQNERCFHLSAGEIAIKG